MNLHFTEAASLALIDRQLELNGVSPAQHEIVRQVIYHTADFEYQSLLRFSQGALAKGAGAIIKGTPIVVDVPEIQVNIVPKLRQTFGNPVYCCATTGKGTEKKTQASDGLEIIAEDLPAAIMIVGQDAASMTTAIELIKSKKIEPSLAVFTPPVFGNDPRDLLINCAIPYIIIDGCKGGASVASAIFNGLVRLTWLAYQ